MYRLPFQQVGGLIGKGVDWLSGKQVYGLHVKQVGGLVGKDVNVLAGNQVDKSAAWLQEWNKLNAEANASTTVAEKRC